MRTSTRLLSALSVVLAALLLVPSTPAEAKRHGPSRSFYGVHFSPVAGGGGMPSSRSVGAIRLWDTWTSWRDLNPAPGVFVWDRLDRAVDAARARGASVSLVLGQTPTWAASDLSQDSVFGDGAGSFPADHARWVEYVQAVALRYRGRISSYEVWNEANLQMFAGMSPARMARLQSLAYRTIERIDPGAIVTAPSVTVRGPSGLRYLKAFTRAGGFRYADVVNVHGYPEPEGEPERAVALIERVRHALARLGVRKPVWDTEVNYGLPWGGNGLAAPLSKRTQAAYASRTMLTHRDAGIRRVYWYAWMTAPFLGVKFEDDGSWNSNAEALWRTSSWLRGRWAGCHVGRRGVWTCEIVRPWRVQVVKWHPSRTVRVRAPKRTLYWTDALGAHVRAHRGDRIRVGKMPVRIMTRRYR